MDKKPEFAFKPSLDLGGTLFPGGQLAQAASPEERKTKRSLPSIGLFGTAEEEDSKKLRDNSPKAPNIPSEATIRNKKEDGSSKLCFGGFSLRVETIQKRISKSEANDLEVADHEGDSLDGNKADTDGSPSKKVQDSTDLIPRRDQNLRTDARNSSADAHQEVGNTPKFKRLGSHLSENHLVLKNSLAVKGIIKPSRFQNSIAVTVTTEPEMIFVEQTERLPMSLFAEEEQDKFLAVKRWEQEMKSIGSPKSQYSRRSNRNVTFNMTDEQERTKTRQQPAHMSHFKPVSPTAHLQSPQVDGHTKAVMTPTSELQNPSNKIEN